MQNVLWRLRWLTSDTEPARLGHADQGVEVGPVGVDLAAGVVDHPADLADGLLVHPVGRGVGDHQGGQLVAGARRSWPLRSARSTLPCSSQATTTTRIPASTAEAALVPWAEDGIRQTSRCSSPRSPVVGPDGEQAGVLALAAGVGLERDPVVAGDLGERRPRAGRSAGGSPRSGRRGVRVDRRRTRATRSAPSRLAALSFIVHEPSGIMVRSRARSRSAEPAQPPHHLGLGPVARWKRRWVRNSDGPTQLGRDAGGRTGPVAEVGRPLPSSRPSPPAPKQDGQDLGHDVGGGGLVERDADPVGASIRRRLTASGPRPLGDPAPRPGRGPSPRRRVSKKPSVVTSRALAASRPLASRPRPGRGSVGPSAVRPSGPCQAP